ncbi:MAG: cupin domain-containing protein [Euryarchaeota archaeon]|nr:cupin domain-containing protein [Euryarchaeota archaeon]
MDIKAFAHTIDPETGALSGPFRETRRTIADLKGHFAAEGAPETLVYIVLEPVEQQNRDMTYAVTVLMPGKVGAEYFMTKGHFHKRNDAGEVYYCLRGNGLVLLQSRLGIVETIEMRPNGVVYVPPATAHRTVNTGAERLVFVAFYSPDAGHDYDSIAKSGFVKRVVENEGRPALVDAG